MTAENKNKEPLHKADLADRPDLLIAGSLMGCLMAFLLFPLMGAGFLWLVAFSLSGFGNDLPPETAFSEHDVATVLNEIEQQQVQEFRKGGSFSSKVKFPPARKSCTKGHSFISSDGNSITNVAVPSSCSGLRQHSRFVSRIFVVQQEQGSEFKLVRVRCVSEHYPNDLIEYGEKYMPRLIPGQLPVCASEERWSSNDNGTKKHHVYPRTSEYLNIK